MKRLNGYFVAEHSEKNELGGLTEKVTLYQGKQEIAHITTCTTQGSVYLQILGLYVESNHRKQGLARRLVEHILEKADRIVMLRVCSYADESMSDEQLIKFYQSIGFVQMPNRNKYHLMYKKIK